MPIASVWLLPSQASTDAISRIMRDLDEQHSSWPRFTPHLTLYSGHSDDLKESFSNLCRLGGPFVAPVKGVDWTMERFKTVFLTFDAAHPAFIAARTAIVDQSKLASTSFNPHVSLIYCTSTELSCQERAKLAESCLGKLLNVEFDRAVVVSPRNGVTWEVVSDWEVVAECFL